MADKPQTAREKFLKDRVEKEKAYKTTHDPVRAYHLMHTATLIRDFPGLQALSNSFTKELKGMNAKQEELDVKEKEEEQKAWNEAMAAEDSSKVVLPEPEEAPSPKPQRGVNQADVGKR